MNKNHVLMAATLVGVLIHSTGCEHCDPASGDYWFQSSGPDIGLSDYCDGKSYTRLDHIHFYGQWKRYGFFRARATLSAELDNGLTRTIVIDFSVLPGFLGKLAGLGSIKITDCVDEECTEETYHITALYRYPDTIE